jgi:hypothetical protein
MIRGKAMNVVLALGRSLWSHKLLCHCIVPISLVHTTANNSLCISSQSLSILPYPDIHIRGKGGRIAFRDEVWNPATGTALRKIIDDAGCLQADACASDAVAREVNCLLGAEAKACLSIDCLAIDAIAAVVVVYVVVWSFYTATAR